MSADRLGVGSSPIQGTILDAKGDLIVATAADTPAVLTVGSANQVLTVDSSTATGLKWATATNTIKQIVANNSTTAQTLATTSYTDITGGSVTITPTSASSSILIQTSFFPNLSRATNDSVQLHLKLFRGATELEEWIQVGFLNAGTASNAYIGITSCVALNYKDSPASTSSITYKIQGKLNTTNNGAQAAINTDGGTLSIVAMEI